MNGLGGNLELWDVNRLIPYEGNAKKHSQDQIKKIAGSIEKFGFTQPIVVDDEGVILIGHGRRLAAMYQGLEQVPVLVREGLSETQKHAIRISDNALPMLGEIDEELLATELRKMMEIEDDFEISLDEMGLTGFDVSKLFDEMEESESEPADSPTPPDNKDYTKPDLQKEKTYSSLFQIVCDCADEDDQQKVYELLTSQGWTCRPLTI